MENEALTPAAYWDILKREKFGMILVFTLVFITVAAVALLLPAVYRSSAIIMIEEQQIPQDFVMTTVGTYAEQRVHNIRQRVLSFTRLNSIINQHNLYSDLQGKWLAEEIIEKMRDDIHVETLATEIIDRRTGRPTAVTTAFTVSYEGKNPQAVLRVTNTLVSLFLEENLRVRQQRVTETSDFLAGEASRIKNELAAADREVAEFKQQHVNELPELFTVNMQSLSAIERAIERVDSELRSLKKQKGSLTTQLAGVPPHIDSIDERLRNRDMLQRLRVELSGLRQRYTDQYPDIAIIKAQIRELETAFENDINTENLAGGNQIGRPDNPVYITLNAQLSGIQANINGLKNQITGFERKAGQYKELIRNTPQVEEFYLVLMNRRTSLQSKYNELVQKHHTAEIAQELERDQKGERFTLMEPPRLPEKPIKPNRLAIFVIGFILAGGAGIGFVAIREFVDTSARTPEALFALTGAPILAGIPKIITKKEQQQKRRNKIAVFMAVIIAICSAVAAFHFFVMDLEIFLAKLMRRLAIF